MPHQCDSPETTDEEPQSPATDLALVDDTADEEKDTPSKATPDLMGLPQELHDVILELAYPEPDGVKYERRYAWEDKRRTQLRIHGLAYVHPRFDHQINKLLVCKAFFIDAARAFVKNHTGIPHLHGAYFSHFDLIGFEGIFNAYTTAIEVRSEDLYIVSLLGRSHAFARLRILVDPDTFMDHGTGYIFRREIAAEEVRALTIYEIIQGFRSLQQLDIVETEWTKAVEVSQSELAVWQKNLGTLKRTIGPVVQERTKSGMICQELSDVDIRARLYAGSTVYLVEPPSGGKGNRSQSDFSSRGAAAQDQPKMSKPLQDSDIPDTASELHNLRLNDEEGVLEWVRQVKESRCGTTSSRPGTGQVPVKEYGGPWHSEEYLHDGDSAC
ncbi:hypothetical protein LTR53_013455 [Teratosphaeriaceae sp. CCFEE 6253]|nr:hypothetical protein LTR53_013455 [Teratosphaeriaceae sp. CCFEE 6253]